MTRTTKVVAASAAALLALALLLVWLAARDPERTQGHASLPREVVAHVRAAQDEIEAMREALVRDDLQRARSSAAAAAERLREGGRAVEGLMHAAHAVAEADSLADARAGAAGVYRHFLRLAAHEPALQEGYRVFRCPMVDGFPFWFQRPEETGNPYMGGEMPACGVAAGWTDAGGPAAPPADPGEIAYWTCSMHPSVRRDEPGTCPICSMDLTPVTVRERDQGLLIVDEHRRRLVHLRTTPVERAPLVVPVRGYAEVTPAEPRRHAVNLRVRGWITKLHAAETGQQVRAGEPLFTLYSPDLYAAQEEFLIARDPSARERLRLYGLTEAQVGSIEEAGRARAEIEILAPRDGYLLRKEVVEGDHVAAGKTVMEIADLSRVWIDLEVFEGDLPLLEAGTSVDLDLSNIPGRSFAAAVEYVYPTLDRARRAARVRLAVDNEDLALKPGMHATGRMRVDLGERLLVPREAVVYTGPRRLVFVDVGEGRLRPQEITVGRGTEEMLEVLSGLEPGDEVVASGTFLIASESRIRSAETIWGEHAGH